MESHHQTKWESLLAHIGPDRTSKEILFDPLIEDWAFAGISEGYREELRQKKDSEQQRAILLDRLRWVVQKRLAGRDQEIMLLFLAGLTQIQIAERLGVSRSTVRRSLLESGECLTKIVGGSDLLGRGFEAGGLKAKVVPLDSPDDFAEFLELAGRVQVEQMALGTFADLREVLVLYREIPPCVGMTQAGSGSHSGGSPSLALRDFE
jgi:transcriptional regulator with XRE-family HTH domain